jgi:FtsH-binding integral membrane protein
VYALLALQLFLTGAITAVTVTQPSIRDFVVRTPESLLVVAILGMCTLCPLLSYRHKHPANLVLLHLFTIFQGCMVAGVCALYASAGMGMLVLYSFACTVSIFVCLSAWVHLTQRDFTFLDTFVFSGMAALLMLGLVGLFLPTFFMQGTIATLGVVVFSGLVLFDTSSMLNTMTPDDTILAVIQLYLDFVNMFLYILELLRVCSVDTS